MNARVGQRGPLVRGHILNPRLLTGVTIQEDEEGCQYHRPLFPARDITPAEAVLKLRDFYPQEWATWAVRP